MIIMYIFAGVGIATVTVVGGWGLGRIGHWLIDTDSRKEQAVDSCFKWLDNKHDRVAIEHHTQRIAYAFLTRYKQYNEADFWLNNTISEFVNEMSAELKRRNDYNESTREAETERIRAGM